MFQTLQPQPDDALLALIGLYRDDPRSNKIDLGVGTYRDEAGGTPVFAAIKSAETILTETQRTKAYLGPEGSQRFIELLRPIAFGQADALGPRLIGVQTPGGSGGLRLGAELINAASPDANVLVGMPTWPNHRPVLEAAGLRVVPYRFFDPATQAIRFDDMMHALSAAEAGDVVLLHGCCHNPTGADLDMAQWAEVTEVMVRRGLLPLIDLAYQGLGEGLEADARGMNHVLANVEEAVVAYSCDKNFGLYRDRVGAVFVLSRDAAGSKTAWGNLLALARVNWSMPPDHGAAAVSIVLENEDLSRSWREELEGMCRRVNAVRQAVAKAEPRLGFLARQRGMFSQLPITPAMVKALLDEHGIYVAGSGRVNVAGLRTRDADTFVAALRAVGAFADA